MFLILSGKWFLGSLPYALSIGVKLFPILFLPLMLPLLRWKRSVLFYLGTALFLTLGIYPLYFPEFAANYARTLKLWFSNFEFNAGVYNAIEQVAVLQGARPWEFIKAYGALMPAIIALVTLIASLLPSMKRPKYWFTGALMISCLYFFTATTVHPWYIIFPLLLGVFTNFRFVILWSATVILSYSAYGTSEVQERPLMLLIEYLSVFGFLVYEILRNNKNLSLSGKKNQGHAAS